MLVYAWRRYSLSVAAGVNSMRRYSCTLDGLYYAGQMRANCHLLPACPTTLAWIHRRGRRMKSGLVM